MAETPGAQLAGCYAYGIATGHAFVDGNKRTSLAATLAFVERNGATLHASEQVTQGKSRMRECRMYGSVTRKRLGAGDMSEVEISAWIRDRLTKL